MGALGGIDIGYLIAAGLGAAFQLKGLATIILLPVPVIGIIVGGVGGAKQINIINEQPQPQIKVEITSINNKDNNEVAVIWKNQEILLKKSEYIKFERDLRNNQSEKIYITIPRKVYMQKFLRMMIE